MALIDREIFGAAVDLAGSGVHDGDLGIDAAARLEQLQLRRAVDREVLLRGRHRIQMARLRRQIEEEIPAQQKMRQCIPTANIGDIDGYQIPNICDIRQVAAVFRDKAVDQQNFGAECNEAPNQLVDLVERFQSINLL